MGVLYCDCNHYTITITNYLSEKGTPLSVDNSTTYAYSSVHQQQNNQQDIIHEQLGT